MARRIVLCQYLTCICAGIGCRLSDTTYDNWVLAYFLSFRKIPPYRIEVTRRTVQYFSFVYAHVFFRYTFAPRSLLPTPAMNPVSMDQFVCTPVHTLYFVVADWMNTIAPR